MNFDKNELFGAALIGFDMIDGPFLKWKKEFKEKDDVVKLDDFAMNFYLSFRGGNSGKKPRAILYDKFYIVAFPKDLELCCLFMKPKGIEANITKLNKIASRIMIEMDEDEATESEEKNQKADTDSDEDTIEEIRRLILNMLNDTKMSTPEMRKYFKLTNAEIWKIMSDLESSKKVIRAGKKGRAQLWTVP